MKAKQRNPRGEFKNKIFKLKNQRVFYKINNNRVVFSADWEFDYPLVSGDYPSLKSFKKAIRDGIFVEVKM